MATTLHSALPCEPIETDNTSPVDVSPSKESSREVSQDDVGDEGTLLQTAQEHQEMSQSEEEPVDTDTEDESLAEIECKHMDRTTFLLYTGVEKHMFSVHIQTILSVTGYTLLGVHCKS